MTVDRGKITRIIIASLIFLAVTAIQGMPTREIQQALLTVAIMCVFACYLKNLWLSLFVAWTVFLYIYFRFDGGATYFFNVFFGCMLYWMAKNSFKKEHISWYINIFLVFVGINCAYMVLQFFDLDFYYYLRVSNVLGDEKALGSFRYLCGFMGFQANMGTLMALSIPIIATRPWKHAWAYTAIPFFFIYTSRSSVSLLAGIIGVLFVLFYRMRKARWWALVISGLILTSLYLVKIDAPMGTIGTRPRMWKTVLRDAVQRPIVGYGLDSFRRFTEIKKRQYCSEILATENGIYMDVWDNAHNLFIQIFFEFGFIGLFLLGGWVRDAINRFNRSVKTGNALGLAGFIVAFFVASMAHFPMYLACMACFIIPMFALFENEIELYP